MRVRIVRTLAFISFSVAASVCGAQPDPVAPVVSAAQPPAGAESLPVQWLTVAIPQGTLLAAVARPQGSGPFPAVVLLHGTHGFAKEYVDFARSLAREGIVAVAACWFSGRSGAGARFVTPLDCPSAPPRPVPNSPLALPIVEALLAATRGLPDVRSDRIALFGHSRGGGAALDYVLTRPGVRAVVLNSAGYPPETSARAAEVSAAVLILHGTHDDPADGGSAITGIGMARAFETALRGAGKAVDTHYYEGAGHNGLFENPGQFDDTVQRAQKFLLEHFRD